MKTVAIILAIAFAFAVLRFTKDVNHHAEIMRDFKEEK